MLSGTDKTKLGVFSLYDTISPRQASIILGVMFGRIVLFLRKLFSYIPNPGTESRDFEPPDGLWARHFRMGWLTSLQVLSKSIHTFSFDNTIAVGGTN